MPSIAQIEDGIPVLTAFTPTLKKAADNNFVSTIEDENLKSNKAHLRLRDELNGNYDDGFRTQKFLNAKNQEEGVILLNGNEPHEGSILNGGVTKGTEDPSLAWKESGQVFNKGPDQILPSNALYTWHADGAVRIQIDEDDDMGGRKPMSVPSLLKRAAERAPERTALAIKRDGDWVKWTYTQFLRDVRTVAKGFIALGLERFHSVCILGFNTPEWFISDLATIFAGGFAAGIYTTNSPESCAYCAIDSKANIFVVEDEKQLAKVLSIKSQLPHLKAIIQYTGEPTEPGVISWTRLLMLGSSEPDTKLDERLSRIAINQACTLIYTSGTTGNPKGVMLNHDNLTWLAHVNAKTCSFRELDEEYISFLPLSHVAAQMADIYCPLTVSATVYFGDKNALKGSLIDTMREVKPTKFLAVPRVWEKMYEKMMEVGRGVKGVKRMIATWAKSKGLEHNMKRMHGMDGDSFGFRLANKLILSRIKEALGLSRCDLHLSGAAPISQDILKYFMSLNIVVTEVYGMSECSGPHCMAIESAFRLGSVGKTMIGCKTRISNPDEDGCGEILMGGRHVSMGYLSQEEKTKGAIDSEGWLHSEDIGRIDGDGYLFITGRLKEILITAGGENVAPVPIEDQVKGNLSAAVSQAVLIGDRKKFLSILLTLKTEVDKDSGEPLDDLQPLAKEWLSAAAEVKLKTASEVMKELYEKENKKLALAIQGGIDGANRVAVSQAQKIQKWAILPKDFSIPGGELGPTMKLKRQTVYDRYADTIAALYD